jgi:tetrathionate reductase subunit B
MGIRVENCIGCGKCVQACKWENDVPDEPFYFRTWVERYIVYNDGEVQVDSPEGGIHGFPEVATDKEILRTFFVPKLCNHCAVPPCTQVCPVGSTYQTKDGVVVIDHDSCVGCAYCIQACPYGARFWDSKFLCANKCDFCYHRITKGLQPACVLACPTGTRVFGDLKDPDSPVYQALHSEKGTMLKRHLGTEPKVYYTDLHKEIV